MKDVTIYTDGACRGNPGPGGWGAILMYRDVRKELVGAEAQTTNNRMELTAAIEALSALKEPCRVDLHTDSQYLRTGMSEWVPAWKTSGWRRGKRGNTQIKNLDLWKRLDAVAALHQIEWHWVKAHNAQPENERCDALANEAIDRQFG